MSNRPRALFNWNGFRASLRNQNLTICFFLFFCVPLERVKSWLSIISFDGFTDACLLLIKSSSSFPVYLKKKCLLGCLLDLSCASSHFLIFFPWLCVLEIATISDSKCIFCFHLKKKQTSELLTCRSRYILIISSVEPQRCWIKSYLHLWENYLAFTTT